MFRKPFRDKLKESGWENAIKNEEGGSNESLQWQRKQALVITTLSDLLLLYEKLPRDKRDQLYNVHNIKKLFDTLLSPDELDNIAKLEIAAYFMEKSINIFKEKHILTNKDTYTIANLLNKPLDEAFNICEEIAYKEKLNQSKFTIKGEKLDYLCDWYKIVNRDRIRIRELIKDKLKIKIKNFIIYQDADNKIIGSFEDDTGKKYTLELKLFKSDGFVSIKINSRGLYSYQTFILKLINGEHRLYYDNSTFELRRSRSLYESYK